MLFQNGCGPFGCGSGEADLVLPNHAFERVGSIESNNLTMIDDGYAITIFSLFHIVRRHKDGESCTLTQPQYMFPDAAPCLWIKANGRLIEKECLWFVQQTTCNLQTA